MRTIVASEREIFQTNVGEIFGFQESSQTISLSIPIYLIPSNSSCLQWIDGFYFFIMKL